LFYGRIEADDEKKVAICGDFIYNEEAHMERIMEEIVTFLDTHEEFTGLEPELKGILVEQIAKVVETDPLTLLANRKKLLNIIQIEWSRSIRYHAPVSMILFNVDKLKQINTDFGQAVGDKVLTTIAETIQKHIRLTDTLGRFGGDEFMVIVPTTNNEQAAWLANKLRQLIERIEFEEVGKVTCSFGVADREASMDVDDWLKIVDQAVKTAKIGGRNKVIDYEEIKEQELKIQVN